MSTKKEIWRLLEPEVDVWQAGDEIQNPIVKWERVPPSWINWEVGRDSQLGRRRMTLPEPQGWISVKERMPTKEEYHKVLWWNGSVCYLSSNAMALIVSPTHWMPLPDPPAPMDPDEEAWEGYKEASEVKDWASSWQEAAKIAFMAGRKSVATEKEDSHG